MRFVPVQSLMEGMTIGRSLYDVNHQLLLRDGSVVQQLYIERIKHLGYQGIYVDDDISKEIVVQDVIRDELRMKAVKSVKDAFLSVNNDSDPKKKNKGINMAKLMITNIVEDLLDSKDTMVNLIDLKFFDDYTFYHSVNVAVLSVLVGVELGLSRSQLFNLGLAAILHDIGKIFISKDILNKPDKLTDEEYDLVKKHPEFAYNYLKETFEIPSESYVAILHHHEHYNGDGYPKGIKEEKIALFGRIICVADVYDALISNRPYRKALLPSEAMEYIMANGGILFDLKLTKIFTRKVAPYPVGTYIRLSDGRYAIVVENFEEACLRPRVKVIADQEGNKAEPVVLDLKDDRNVRNVTIIGVNDVF